MTTTHNTEYPVWPECMDHPEPDGVEDPRYLCAGKGHGCYSLPLAVWGAIPYEREAAARVLCLGCTTFHKEQDAWEDVHENGTGLDWSGVICKVNPPTLYCLECSEANEDGEWVQHEHESEATR